MGQSFTMLAAAGKVPTSTLLLLLGGLIIAVVVLGLVVLKLRASMLAKESMSPDQEGLLSGLRRMRDSGEITPEEFDAARKTMVARAVGSPKPANATPARATVEKHARPGFDLTGAPLPKPPPRNDG